MSKKHKILYAIFAILLLGLLIYILNKHDGRLHIYQLNIGQGDSAYILTPDRNDIVIDGGPDKKVLNQLGKVMKFGDRDIDLLIATHSDKDHIGGIKYILKNYNVREIWTNGIDHTTNTYQDLQDAIEDEQKQGATVKQVERGDFKQFSSTQIRVLSPFPGTPPDSSQNDASVVTRLAYNDFSALFTGDAEFITEEKIINNNLFEVKSDVLKVGHHGSAYATSEAFLKAVDPQIAVLSFGKNNSYGHPSKRVVDLLKNAHIQIFETINKNFVQIISDGTKIDVK